MVDPRFYVINAPICLAEIAQQFGGELLQGDSGQKIHTIAILSNATDGAVSFIRGKKELSGIRLAGGLIIADKNTAGILTDEPIAILVHEQPQFCFSLIAQYLVSERCNTTNTIPVSKSACIHKTANIGYGVVVEDDVSIGKDTRIDHHTTLGVGVKIGNNCQIAAGVHIRFAEIGDNVNILPGAIIGGQGLGVAAGEDGHIDIPHFGTVILEDNVTIGSNTTIDRGVFGATKIGQGSKIDNLVQIAHNVEIGKNCIFAAHVGISGSVKIGDRVLMGGKAGIIDHATIGNDAVLLAGSAAMKNIPEGETWGGIPAQPARKYFREIAAIRSLVKKGIRSK